MTMKGSEEMYVLVFLPLNYILKVNVTIDTIDFFVSFSWDDTTYNTKNKN